MVDLTSSARADSAQEAIAAAGAIPALVACLSSPAVGVQAAAAGAIQNLADNGTRQHAAARVRHEARAAANSVALARSGAVPVLVALLGSPDAGVQETAAGALRNLALLGAQRVHQGCALTGVWGGGLPCPRRGEPTGHPCRGRDPRPRLAPHVAGGWSRGGGRGGGVKSCG